MKFLNTMFMSPEDWLVRFGVRFVEAVGDEEPVVPMVFLELGCELGVGDVEGEKFLILGDESVGDGDDLLGARSHIDSKEFKLAVVFGAFEGEGEPNGGQVGLSDKFGDSSRDCPIDGGEIFARIDRAHCGGEMGGVDLDPKGEKRSVFPIEIE